MSQFQKPVVDIVEPGKTTNKENFVKMFILFSSFGFHQYTMQGAPKELCPVHVAAVEEL